MPDVNIDKKTPYPFQESGAAWMAKGNAILADEVGVGKTGTAIVACDKINAKKFLVVCPGIARDNWEEEVHAFQTLERSVGVIRGTKKIPDADVLVTSYSLIRNVPVLKKLLERRWDAIIYDEGDYLKNPNAIQTRAAYGNQCNAHFGLSSVSGVSWPLSGTIMRNHPGELWSHMTALFGDVTDGKTYNEWVDHYCQMKDRRSRAIVGVKKMNEAELVRRIAPHVLRRLKKQVNPSLPPLTFGHVAVTPDSLPPRPAEVTEVERVISAAMDKSGTSTSYDALSSVAEVHLASLRKWTGVAKAPAVADYLLEELNSGLDKVVVFAVHQEVIETLLAKLPGSVALYGPVPDKQRQHYIKAFQGRIPGDDPPVIIIQMEIGSSALTLTSACNVVFAESSWVPRDMEQAAARCHRNGQKRPVLARLFSLKGSLDEKINKTLVRKIRQISSFNSSLVAPVDAGLII